MITYCKTIEALEKVFAVEGVGICKEDDIEPGVDGYFFSVCYESSKPNVDNQCSWLFLFNKVENEKTEKKQSRALINLKVDYKNHLSTKKFCKQKKEDRLRKDKSYKEILSRRGFFFLEQDNLP